MALLLTRKLSRRFGAAVALDGLDLALEEGERLAVLGPSGSGKTTLLRLIAGLDPPSDGEVEIAGRVASRADTIALAPEKRQVALVFQGLALFPHMTALEQVRFVASDARRALELLASVGLEKRPGALPDQLSGGERQRLALARALAQKPRLLLLDEPFANLDPTLHGSLRDELKDLLERTRTALVVVTHEREDALALASRVLLLEGGRVAAQGPIDDLVAHPGSRAVVRALGLGFVLEATAAGADEVETPLGRARARHATERMTVLVRPEQARVLPEEELGGTPVEVVSVELVAPEAPALRHEARVRVASGEIYAARAAAPVPRPGARVRVRLEGELEVLER
ncbi:MAG TPA: ABC transporter ATP-binding protein [Planctomycetota bacterium]|nr:ABC transporter ATP-binding protein [Planctomycetota bacterium]